MTTPLITRLEEAAETSQAMTDTVRVPREPTPKMVRAGCAVTCVECFADCKSSDAAAIYRAMLAAFPQGEGSSTDPAPIKPSGDTGELRGEVNGLLARYFPEILIDQNGSAYGVSFVVREQRAALTGAILDLIQSERGSSPIGQNDQPGLAFSDAGEP